MNKASQLFFMFLCVSLASCGGGGGGNTDEPTSQLAGACSLRVFNGEECPSARGPVVQLIGESTDGTPAYVCTGAFISPTDVVTAAHCLPDTGYRLVAAFENGEKISASIYAAHPKYNPNTEDGFDIAVVSLSQSANVTSLPLLISEEVRPGQTATVLGFGQDETGLTAFEQGDSLLSPQSAQLTVQQVDQDSILFGSRDKGICGGDSGGPAVLRTERGNYGIIGIAIAGFKSEDCGPASVSQSQIEQILGHPFTPEDQKQFDAIAVNGLAPLNLFSNIQNKDTLEFITSVVPGVEIR